MVLQIILLVYTLPPTLTLKVMVEVLGRFIILLSEPMGQVLERHLAAPVVPLDVLDSPEIVVLAEAAQR